ncbi:hypothetical protein RB594_007818 [Gaeumannomyces avenae]
MENALSDLPTALPAEEAPTLYLPFLSHEPKLGDPSLGLQSFRHAKLRKFPKPYSSIRIIGDLSGGGADFDPYKHSSTNYWTFERECRISAKLESIYTMYRHASASGCPLQFRPSPAYRRAVKPYLEAISDEFADKYCRFASFESSTPATVDIPECYGWTQLDEAIPLMYRSTALRWEKPFVIIYELVPGSTRPDDVGLCSELLFYLLDLGPEILV